MSGFNTALRSVTLGVRQPFLLPQSLIFFITSRCNARCGFCLYYDQVNDPVAKSQELTPAEADKIARNYGPLHYLGLSGGEPFIRKDLTALVQPFIDHCGLAVLDIPSNFYYHDNMLLVCEQLLSANPDLVLDLQFSVDHLDEKHDEIRKVKGLFKKGVATFKALELLQQRYPNLKLKVNIVYLPENRDDLDLIFDTLQGEINPDRIQLTYPHDLLPKEMPASDLAHYRQYADLTSSKYSKGNDLYAYGLRSLKYYANDLLEKAVTGELNTGAYCEAGRNIAVINEKGDVFACEPLWEEKLGNLREVGYDMRAILHSGVYDSFRQKYLGKGKCNCTWSCAMNTHVSVSTRKLPGLAIKAGKLLLNDRRRRNG